MSPVARSQTAKTADEENVGRQSVIDKESESELGLPPQKRRRRLDKPVKDGVSNKKSKVNKKAKKSDTDFDKLVKEIFYTTSDSGEEFEGFTQEEIDESNLRLIPMEKVVASVNQDNNASRIVNHERSSGQSTVNPINSPRSLDSKESSNSLNGKVKPLSTEGEGNCFFHAVFGTLCGGKYKTDKAQEMRMEWCKFLGNFKSPADESMPKELKETLLLIFREVFKEVKPEKHSSDCIYKEYLAKIAEQSYYVYVNEIVILASLANIKIKLHIEGQSSDGIEPNKKLLSKNYKRNDEIWGKRKQVEIYHDGISHFSYVKSSVEQSLLKDIGNSPIRGRNLITPKSPGKENRKRSREIELDSPTEEANQQSHSSSKRARFEPKVSDKEIAPQNYFTQTSTLLKSSKSIKNTKINISPIKRVSESSRVTSNVRNSKGRRTSSSYNDSETNFSQDLNGESDRSQTSSEPNENSWSASHLSEDIQMNCKLSQELSSESNQPRPSSPTDSVNDSGLGSSLSISRKILETGKELEIFLKKCKGVGKIAIHCDYGDKELSKVSLSCNKDEDYYIDENFKQNALEKINQLLSLGEVKKVIVYDIKEVKKTLSGIEKILDSVDDLKVMSYSLDTKKHDNSLSSIVEHNFNRIEGAFSAGTLVEVHNELECRLFKQEKLRKIYDNYDKPLTKAILNMEKKGVRVDAGKLKELEEQLNKKIEETENEIHKSAGKKFDIGTPKELGRILFKKMKLRYKTKLNYWGTDNKALREFQGRGVEIAGKILRWRSLSKLKSGIEGYRSKVDEHDGRIHTDFLTTKTKTGRLSSKDPNLQSIPNDEEIKQAFIAEEGHKLISADYEQMEVRILAEIAGVKKLKEAFGTKEDIYKSIARKIFNIPKDKEVKDENRQKAKEVTLGIIYGKSKLGLAEELKVTPQQADEYIKQFFSRYSEVETYKIEAITDARAYGYVKTMSGRRLNINYINNAILSLRNHARRSAVNAPIQGTGADIMRLAMINLSKELKAKNLGEVINTIHDELVVEAKNENAEEVQQLMQKEMEEAAKEILGIVIPVKISVGNSVNFGKQETRDRSQDNLDDSGIHDTTQEKNEDFTMNCDDSGILQEEEYDDLINDYHDLGNEEYRNSFFVLWELHTKWKF